MPNYNVFQSHCWNIDGYKRRERKVIKDYYSGEKLVKTIENTEKSDMVHCDFGWGGPSNGYYATGVFKAKDSNVELDPGVKETNKVNYNTFIHLITY